MKRKKIHNAVLSAVFLAVALVLPFLTGQIPQIGTMLLPMHIPVMLCGFVCGAGFGAAVGFAAPILRSLIFGQPLLFPVAVAMSFELAAYGLLTGIIFSLFKNKNIFAIFLSLISAMIGGRLVWCVAMSACMGFSSFTFSIFSASSLISAIPGVVLQLVLIPSFMLIMRRAHVLRSVSDKKSKESDECKIPLDLLAEIYEKSEGCERFVIAIDGRCAAGKTTLADALAKKLGASVFHVDDFYLPRNQRSKKKLSECGGNIDRERFAREILAPLRDGSAVNYRKYNCKTDKIQKKITVQPHKISIIEGSYSLHPDFCGCYDLKVFIDIDEQFQRERVLLREGEESAQEFFEKWIPLEEKYISELNVIDRCDKIINAIR